MSLWRRLGRLWGQSRIRLPRPGLDAAQLGVGDRLQIGGELWRVVARASSSPTVFALESSALPSRRAELRCDGPRWELVEDATAVGLARSEILYFPVEEARS